MTTTPFASLQLPVPETGRGEAERYVAAHFDGLFLEDEVTSSERFRGGQSAADDALERFDVTGYAANRNEAYPEPRRGASGLSPYIRHGLISLRRTWDAVAGGPDADVDKFRDELLWQEYARHWYARLGTSTSQPLRRRFLTTNPIPEPDPEVPGPPGWDQDMACLELTIGELEDDGYLVNQTRMWLASHWTVRTGLPWRAGEDFFFQHLLDGSRAANRLGWQWTAGIGSNRSYGFSRWQVERRAPGLCASCEVAVDCPIYSWPDEAEVEKVDVNPLVAADPDLATTRGPERPTRTGRTPELVWLTAESLGQADPALVANPDLPAVFVFDQALLASLRLSSKRIVFLVETLAELALHRPIEIHLGDPVLVLGGALGDRPVATTFAPVPGWRSRSARIEPVEVHPWPWLQPPIAGSIGSFSAWNKQISRG